MMRPYQLNFDTPALQLNDGLAPWSKYPFATARNRVYKVFSGAEFTSQRLGMTPYFVELFEMRAQHSFKMSYEVTQKQHFLFLMLQGSVGFKSPEGFYISYARDGHFAFVSNPPGRYMLDLNPGHFTALCIAFSADWLTFFSQDQPVFRSFLNTEENGHYPMLPYCRIDRSVARWLKSLYSELQHGQGTLDGQLRYYISLILERYNHLAGIKLQSLPWKTKEYLDMHFRDQELSLSRLTESMGVSERTLRHQFKGEFQTTIHHYYTCRRLSYATDLMEKYQAPIGKIWSEAGYNDESTFRYEMKRFGLL